MCSVFWPCLHRVALLCSALCRGAGPTAHSPRCPPSFPAGGPPPLFREPAPSELRAGRWLGKPGNPNVCLLFPGGYWTTYAIWRFQIFVSISMNKKVEEQSFNIRRSPVFTRGRDGLIYVQPNSKWDCGRNRITPRFTYLISCNEFRSVSFYFISHQVIHCSFSDTHSRGSFVCLETVITCVGLHASTMP